MLILLLLPFLAPWTSSLGVREWPRGSKLLLPLPLQRQHALLFAGEQGLVQRDVRWEEHHGLEHKVPAERLGSARHPAHTGAASISGVGDQLSDALNLLKLSGSLPGAS